MSLPWPTYFILKSIRSSSNLHVFTTPSLPPVSINNDRFVDGSVHEIRIKKFLQNELHIASSVQKDSELYFLLKCHPPHSRKSNYGPMYAYFWMRNVHWLFQYHARCPEWLYLSRTQCIFSDALPKSWSALLRNQTSNNENPDWMKRMWRLRYFRTAYYRDNPVLMSNFTVNYILSIYYGWYKWEMMKVIFVIKLYKYQ